mgnify:FL=1
MNLSIAEKLKILGAGAKYDVSCASSGINRKAKPGQIGSTAACGLCHTFAEDGRCISLLKVLMSNQCIFNCAYCVNRADNDIVRTAFTPREIADLTIEFYRRNYIEGLFLSSGVVGTPDNTMELMIKAIRILRNEYRFGGYIHAKIIPGSDKRLADILGRLCDRISINMEFASHRALNLLASDKSHKDIISSMGNVTNQLVQNKEERRKFKSAPLFAPAGQSTQLIIGATAERDYTIVRLAQALYKKLGMKRVYYSAYMPIVKHPDLPGKDTSPPIVREHRLYQADWLMRFYGFTPEEIFSDKDESLDLEVDPKISWALKHADFFPVEVNSADYYTLLRVPGIGQRTAQRIVQSRRFSRLDDTNLVKMGMIRRAFYFITVNGRFLGRCLPDNPALKFILKDNSLNGQITFDNIIKGKQIEDEASAAKLISAVSSA